MTPRASKVLWYILLAIHGLAVLLPMIWMISTALKDSWTIFVSPWGYPEHLAWANFPNAWKKGVLGWKFINSIYISLAALCAALGIASMAAYVFGRFKFWGRRTLFFVFIAGLTLPAFLGIVPLFMLMKSLGILNTRYGLTFVYTAFSLPFSIFVLTGFFRGLPGELAEAASMDGCSPFGVFFKVMLPLAKPGLVTVGIFIFISLWNEFQLALVLLTKPENSLTLTLGIANLTMAQRYQSDWGAMFAGLSIGVIPTILLYSFLQKHIQAGLTAGAVKG